MPQPLRILAIHAHPDDLEIQVAGTLALLRGEGHHVTMATMTPGDCGSAEHSADSIATIRREEARKAAEMIEADALCLEFRDLAIFNDDPSRRKVTEILRRVAPDIVITAPPIDYLCDHEATSLLVRDACFCASVPNYVTKQWEPAPVSAKIPHLYYVDAIPGSEEPPAPGFYVDVTDVFPVKRAMLACHASQRNWLLRQHGMDEYLDSQAEWSSKRGREIGVAHAEGLRQHLGQAYPHDNLLLKLLGQDGRGSRLDRR